MPFLTSDPTTLMLWAVIGYLFGSIPSGMILARVMNLGNLREIGSGNIGATNVLRTGNKAAAALTLLFDAGKAIVPLLLARHFAGEDAAQLAALAAFIGHCFPVWLKFKGGKGVATLIGIYLALYFPLGLAVCATWLVCAVISRYSSLSALLAAGMAPVWAALLGAGSAILLGFVLGLLTYARHWQNIQRLRAGTESKIGQK
ncbi:glycerol-3-phosphate 1-O-acyltransferase PlsY [Cognatishimia sp. MH4019]|uniref:glycerol-3-phosphate 1-O-acyltransferase PlsY n=1 Tax=Cognatishimia sp. MH4019 TaxID=2854030 RepID=UPI001CD5F6FA|nr:glycerol-3-phosphate 1-O-acyltransferase PlsY [Cognatishimia sp. MH4019]